MFVLPVSRVAARAHRQPAFNGHPLDAGRALDRLFDDALERAFSASPAGAATRLPALDLQETDAGYTAQVDLPGFAKEDVKVAIDGKRVSIEAVAPKVAANQARPTRRRTPLARHASWCASVRAPPSAAASPCRWRSTRPRRRPSSRTAC